MFPWILVALLMAALLLQTFYTIPNWRKTCAIFERLYEESDKDREESERGIFEIEQNYQNDYLQLRDETNTWIDIASELEKIRLDHQVFCLPVLGDQILETDEEGDTPIFDEVLDELWDVQPVGG